MSASDWIQGSLSVIALIVAIAAYLINRQTARANERMAKANEQMAIANDEANAISRDMRDANQQLLAANEQMAKSAEVAAKAAREAADNAGAAHREGKMAVIELVTGTPTPVGYNRTGDDGSFRLRLRNQGQATAYDLTVRGIVTINRQGFEPTPLGPVRLAQITPGTTVDCQLPVNKVQFGDVDTREVEFIVNFIDGLGKEETRFRIRIYNYWDMEWSGSRLE